MPGLTKIDQKNPPADLDQNAQYLVKEEYYGWSVVRITNDPKRLQGRYAPGWWYYTPCLTATPLSFAPEIYRIDP